MKFRFEKLIMAVFLIGSIVLLVNYNIGKPHILVLHSYDKSYSWVKDVNIGLKRELDKRGDYAVTWHYLDTKRHPDDSYKNNVGIVVRRMIDEAPPNVIIAVDDDAQQYVTRYYLERPDIKIVFADRLMPVRPGLS